MTHPSTEPAHWPRWCCAILRDARGRYLLERRPAHEQDAPGLLTCFGGTRERGEDPESCLRRELLEELGIVAGTLEFCLELSTPKGIAWYYRVAWRDGAPARALEPGFEALWIEPSHLETVGVGSWNLAALRAELRGESHAHAD